MLIQIADLVIGAIMFAWKPQSVDPFKEQFAKRLLNQFNYPEKSPKGIRENIIIQYVEPKELGEIVNSHVELDRVIRGH
jgi:hypothetical protein